MMTMYKENRKNALMGMNTEELAIAIGEYFDTHATMPGQKDLKEAAERIVATKAEHPEFEISDETKEQIAARFTEIVVRELKVENLKVQNINKENKDDFSVLKPTNLNLVEADAIQANGKSPAKKIYKTDAHIYNGKVLVNGYEIGFLSKGFQKNNPAVECPATLVATDYSNGKFTNVSYTVIADIAA